MKIEELRKKTKAELEKMHEDNIKSLNEFRFGISGSKVKDVKKGKNLKRTNAQILTILGSIK